MTIRAYITDKLQAFGITEAQLVDFSLNLGYSLDNDYTTVVAEDVGKGMVSYIEEMVLAPKQSNISESGFSMSWDFNHLGQYYIWLCKKWGVKPNEDVLPLLGISTISDQSNRW